MKAAADARVGVPGWGRLSRARLVRVLSLAVLAACGGDSGQQQVAAADSADSQQLDAWVDRLQRAYQSTTYGVLDGPPEQTFGQLTAVSVANGRVLVADRLMHAVRVYDTSMVYLGSLAPPGGGPLETRSLMGIAWGPDGQIVVADGSTVKVFERDEAGAVKLLANPRLRARPDDVCVTGGRMFVRVSFPTLSGTVVSVRMDGSDENVFGEQPVAGDPYTRATLSRGLIACTLDPARILITFEGAPTIVAYDSTGQKTWQADIHPFRRAKLDTVVVHGMVGVGHNYFDSPDRIISITPLDSNVVAVQVFRHDPPKRGAPFSTGRVDTYVVSATTGSQRLAGADVGVMIAADPAGYWVKASVGGAPTLRRMLYERPTYSDRDPEGASQK
jgi:hypothetical protein